MLLIFSCFTERLFSRPRLRPTSEQVQRVTTGRDQQVMMPRPRDGQRERADDDHEAARQKRRPFQYRHPAAYDAGALILRRTSARLNPRSCSTGAAPGAFSSRRIANRMLDADMEAAHMFRFLKGVIKDPSRRHAEGQLAGPLALTQRKSLSSSARMDGNASGVSSDHRRKTGFASRSSASSRWYGSIVGLPHCDAS